MEYEVLAPGCELIPNFHFFDSDGVCLFVAADVREYDRPSKPVGRYRSIIWIPGNFLAEATVSVHVALSTIRPSLVVHFFERDAVAFEVIDRQEGNSARGHYAGPYPGVIRPIFEWDTECLPVAGGAVA
jgi:lipopolysaccharide transport system ATP-binding protein